MQPLTTMCNICLSISLWSFKIWLPGDSCSKLGYRLVTWSFNFCISTLLFILKLQKSIRNCWSKKDYWRNISEFINKLLGNFIWISMDGHWFVPRSFWSGLISALKMTPGRWWNVPCSCPPTSTAKKVVSPRQNSSLSIKVECSILSHGID